MNKILPDLMRIFMAAGLALAVTAAPACGSSDNAADDEGAEGPDDEADGGIPDGTGEPEPTEGSAEGQEGGLPPEGIEGAEGVEGEEGTEGEEGAEGGEPACVTDDDCNEGEICDASGECTVGEGVEGVEGTEGEEGAEGAEGQEGAETGATGSPCESELDCDSFLCAAVDDVGNQECTNECTSDTECPATHVCVDIGTGTGLCLPSTGTGQSGDACDSWEDCRGGICAQRDDTGTDNYCTQYCLDGTCPEGFACVSAGSSGLVCVESLGEGQTGDECVTADDCAAALCAPPLVDDGQPAQCTVLCLDGECPAGLACYGLASGAICIRAPADRLPNGDECAGDQDCESLACSFDFDTFASLCTESCAFAGCPSGKKCVSDPLSGARMCAPIVPKETGSACDVDGDCISGACVRETVVAGRCADTCDAGCDDGYGCSPGATMSGGTGDFCQPDGSKATGTECGLAEECQSGICTQGFGDVPRCSDPCPAGQADCGTDEACVLDFSGSYICSTGIGEKDTGEPCVDATECKSLSCVYDLDGSQVCAPQCPSGECPSGFYCASFFDFFAGEVFECRQEGIQDEFEFCDKDAACSTTVCHLLDIDFGEGVCSRKCAADADCEPHWACQSGVCGPSGTGKAGEECKLGQECESGFCLGEEGGPLHCAADCSTNPCGPGDACVFMGSGFACQPGAGSTPTGGACIANEDCEGLLCFTDNGGERLCAESCPGKNCPAGYFCFEPGDGNATCLREAIVPPGGPCNLNEQCKTGRCLIVDEFFGDGYCTPDCATDADCPQKFTCGTGLDGAPACIAAGKGVQGEPCGLNDFCESTICAGDIDGARYCSKECLDDADCGAGWYCYDASACYKKGVSSFGEVCDVDPVCDTGRCYAVDLSVAPGFCTQACGGANDPVCPANSGCVDSAIEPPGKVCLPGAVEPQPDGGVTADGGIPDAGSGELDAGVPDAGSGGEDAGGTTPDAGDLDGGLPPDGGLPVDGGPTDGGP